MWTCGYLLDEIQLVRVWEQMFYGKHLKLVGWLVKQVSRL